MPQLVDLVAPLDLVSGIVAIMLAMLVLGLALLETCPRVALAGAAVLLVALGDALQLHAHFATLVVDLAPRLGRFSAMLRWVGSAEVAGCAGCVLLLSGEPLLRRILLVWLFTLVAAAVGCEVLPKLLLMDLPGLGAIEEAVEIVAGTFACGAVALRLAGVQGARVSSPGPARATIR